MGQICTYSPLPIQSYFLQGADHCVMRVIERQSMFSEATWNLYYLSMPSLDLVPGAGKNWYKVYKTDGLLVNNLLSYISLDANLHDHLLQHPAKFVAWFKRSRYIDLDPKWAEVVIARAEEVALRLSRVVRQNGNLIEVRFGT